MTVLMISRKLEVEKREKIKFSGGRVGKAVKHSETYDSEFAVRQV